MAIRVQSVDQDSPAQALGIRPGATLLSADGNELTDMLDYQFFTASSRFQLAFCQEGKLQYSTVEKDEYEPLGCNFATYLGDQKHSCENHCMFCFIDQLPAGMRSTLYFKDDDERLSFLFGNYITLTNMSERELDRIVKMHISPINVSVHTTDPALRVRMLANKRAAEIMTHLHRLAEAGIQLNCQLVLCRGVNDGDALRKTLADLLALGESVDSIAAVPSGLTDHRAGLYPLQAYDAASSAEVLDILEQAGDQCLAARGRRVIFPGDEWYLAAGRPIPPDAFYEDYAQLENGVGMWRKFHDSFLEELSQPRRFVWPRRVDVVTGELAGPLIRQMADILHGQYSQVSVNVHVVKNNFFGGNVTVTGLLTGRDITAQCRKRLRSRTLLIPDVMLRAERDLFLDDMTPAQLAKALGARVNVIPSDGAGTCRAMLGEKPREEQ